MREWLELDGPPIALPGTSYFNIAKEIRVGKTIGKYRVAHVSPGFYKQFGPAEKNVPPVLIQSRTMTNRDCFAKDIDIIKEMGGKKRIFSHIVNMVRIIELGKLGPGLFNYGEWGLLKGNFHYKLSRKGEIWSIGWSIQNDGLDTELSFWAEAVPCKGSLHNHSRFYNCALQ